MSGIGFTKVINGFGTVGCINYTTPLYDFTRRFSTLIPTIEVWEGGGIDLLNGTTDFLMERCVEVCFQSLWE